MGLSWDLTTDDHVLDETSSAFHLAMLRGHVTDALYWGRQLRSISSTHLRASLMHFIYAYAPFPGLAVTLSRAKMHELKHGYDAYIWMLCKIPKMRFVGWLYDICEMYRESMADRASDYSAIVPESTAFYGIYNTIKSLLHGSDECVTSGYLFSLLDDACRRAVINEMFGQRALQCYEICPSTLVFLYYLEHRNVSIFRTLHVTFAWPGSESLPARSYVTSEFRRSIADIDNALSDSSIINSYYRDLAKRSVPDDALTMFTQRGRNMGRDYAHFCEQYLKCSNTLWRECDDEYNLLRDKWASSAIRARLGDEWYKNCPGYQEIEMDKQVTVDPAVITITALCVSN